MSPPATDSTAAHLDRGPSSYQDIASTRGFSSSRLLKRFESIKDEKKQNSTAKLSSNSSRLTLSIHSNTADKWT